MGLDLFLYKTSNSKIKDDKYYAYNLINIIRLIDIILK